jgi:GntR family transcriptional regulator
MSLLNFRLEARSGVPYYVQLIEQVEQAIRFGLLHPGDQLPTVREVVAEVAVNPNTVLRAYRELEHRGLVTLRAGSGTFVAETGVEPLDQALYRSLRVDLEHWVAGARQRGVDDATLAALFDHVLRSMLGAAIA